MCCTMCTFPTSTSGDNLMWMMASHRAIVTTGRQDQGRCARRVRSTSVVSCKRGVYVRRHRISRFLRTR